MLSISSSFPSKKKKKESQKLSCFHVSPIFFFFLFASSVYLLLLFIQIHSFHSTSAFCRVRVNCTQVFSFVFPYSGVFDFMRSSQSIAISEKWSFHHFSPTRTFRIIHTIHFERGVYKIRMINMYDSVNFLSSYCTDISFIRFFFFCLLLPLSSSPSLPQNIVFECVLRHSNGNDGAMEYVYTILTFH